MDKQEFLKQMILFGQELLKEEQKEKLNLDAILSLRKLYEALDVAVNSAADLERTFIDDKKKRGTKAKKAVELIMKVQELMNPMAEDEDIQLA